VNTYVVKWFNYQLGYGFLINPDNSGLDILVDAKEIKDLNPPCLFPGDVVTAYLMPPRRVTKPSVRSSYGPRACHVRLVRRA